MGEALALIVLGVAALAWFEGMKARERALEAGREACGRYGLQLLDDTVSLAGIRLARDDEGRLRVKRTYSFEFSDTGDNRRQGAIVTLGPDLVDLHLEPYRLQ